MVWGPNPFMGNGPEEKMFRNGPSRDSIIPDIPGLEEGEIGYEQVPLVLFHLKIFPGLLSFD